MSMEYPCIYFEKNGRCRKFSGDTAVSYCVMGPCPEQTLSNADRIRAMSDEELSRHCNGCPPGKDYMTCEFVGACDACWLAWLQQPYKEGET